MMRREAIVAIVMGLLVASQGLAERPASREVDDMEGAALVVTDLYSKMPEPPMKTAAALSYHQDSPAEELQPAPPLGAPDGYAGDDYVDDYANGDFCGCDTCGAGDCSCQAWYHHRTGVFAEYLYLRARDMEVAYATEVNGPLTGRDEFPVHQGVQVSPVGVVDMEYESAYRFGGSFALDCESSISAQYTRFDSRSRDDIQRTGTNVIRPLVTHPLTENAASDWVQANAQSDVEFQLADVEYRWMFSHSDVHVVNLAVGARYGRVEQNFRSQFLINGERRVETDVIFEGGGLRGAIDFERRVGCRGLLIYGKAGVNFLFGDETAHYTQTSPFDVLEVDTDIEVGKVVSLVEAELGIGWVSPNERVRVTAGYLVNAWFNTVSTDEWINAVQANEFAGLGDGLSFDGFSLRAEYRF